MCLQCKNKIARVSYELMLTKTVLVVKNNSSIPKTFSLQKIQSTYTNWTLKARELFLHRTKVSRPWRQNVLQSPIFNFVSQFYGFVHLQKNAVELLVHFGQREYFITRLVKSTKRKWVVTLYSIMYMICTFIFWR